jgi:hypothetical protein
VTLNSQVVAQVTEPDLVIRSSKFRQNILKDTAENVKNRKVNHTRRVGLDNTSIVASVKDGSQQDLYQQFEHTNIRWTVIEKQFLMWSNLFRLAKQITLQISINHIEDSYPTSSKRGDKRASTLVTKRMLAERDIQIDAESVSGQRFVWRDVCRKMYCSGSPCENEKWVLWAGPCWQETLQALDAPFETPYPFSGGWSYARNSR